MQQGARLGVHVGCGRVRDSLYKRRAAVGIWGGGDPKGAGPPSASTGSVFSADGVVSRPSGRGIPGGRPPGVGASPRAPALPGLMASPRTSFASTMRSPTRTT